MYTEIKWNILGDKYSNLGWQALTVIEKYPGNYDNRVKTLFPHQNQNEVLQHVFFADEFN